MASDTPLRPYDNTQTITLTSTVQNTDINLIISLSDLLSMNETLIAIEGGNKQRFENFQQAPFIQKLHSWAATGFPDSYLVYEIEVVPSEKTGNTYACSDGIKREIWEYIPFFLGYSINTFVENMNKKIKDITLTSSLQEEPSIVFRLHASK